MKQASHSFSEDVLALFSATIFVSLGLALFESLGLLVGGTAGIALLLAKLIDVNFSLIFFVINLPFYFLAWSQLGWRFTLNTFASVAVVSILVDNMSLFVQLEYINQWFGAAIGGLMIGMGLLILFRHKSSLGGLGILAFYLQTKFNIRAGKFQMLVDLIIVLVSFFIVSPLVLLISILGASVLNIVIAVNHKPGRYIINDSEALSEHQK